MDLVLGQAVLPPRLSRMHGNAWTVFFALAATQLFRRDTARVTPAPDRYRAARFSALITPRSDASTIDSLMPTPHSTRSPTSISR